MRCDRRKNIWLSLLLLFSESDSWMHAIGIRFTHTDCLLYVLSWRCSGECAIFNVSWNKGLQQSSLYILCAILFIRLHLLVHFRFFSLSSPCICCSISFFVVVLSTSFSSCSPILSSFHSFFRWIYLLRHRQCLRLVIVPDGIKCLTIFFALFECNASDSLIQEGEKEGESNWKKRRPTSRKALKAFCLIQCFPLLTSDGISFSVCIGKTRKVNHKSK